MKNTVLILLLSIPFFLSAQDLSKKKNSIHILGGAAMGHGISQFYHNNPDVAVYPGPPSDNYAKSIAPAFNYNFGLEYRRTIVPQLSFKTGARFSNWNLSVTDHSPKSYILKNYYLEIPLTLQYDFNQKKLSPYVEAGGSFMINLNHNNHSSGASWAFHVGAGLSYQLTETISIFGQLSTRIQVIRSITYTAQHYNPSTNEPSYGRYVYPYQVGLELGAAVSF